MPQATHAVPESSLARAGRHAILRRLAPALRHELVAQLQSLGLMADALNARLERGALAPADVQAAASKLNRLARQAVAGALQVSTWMESGENEAIALDQGVAECVHLLAARFNFQGLRLQVEGPLAATPVGRSALRYLLAGALLALADAAEAPGDLVVRGEIEEDGAGAVLLLELRPQSQDGELTLRGVEAGALAWTEMEALAQAEGARIESAGHRTLLRLRPIEAESM